MPPIDQPITLLRNDQELKHRRNMWSFFGYNVGLAYLNEQVFSIDFIESLYEAGQSVEILLVAVNGSDRFAHALSELHAIDGLFREQDIPDWRKLAAPNHIIRGTFFEDPGAVSDASELKL